MRSFTYECDACGMRDKRLFTREQTVPDKVKCKVCGKTALKTYALSNAKPTRGWPMVSEASGVYPDQINEARQTDMRLGVPCEFTSDGGRIFNDRGHRRDWLRAHKLIDRDGGYGD